MTEPAASTSSTSPPPRVSIGVPVYNGERFLARAIDSLLAQTFTDFELIITDNGSTDATESMCREYASRDARVRYHRSDTNRGVVTNFNWSAELARGQYFKWSAADDMAAPTFLERCVAVLDANPDVIVAFPQTTIIDERDATKRINDYDADADHPEPHVRFDHVINLDVRRHCAQEIYGVTRRDVLMRTTLYEPVVRTDSILLARLALAGRFRRVEEPLFLNREHDQRSVQLVPGKRAATRSRLSHLIGVGPIPPAEFWNSALRGRINFPEWRVLHEYFRSIDLAGLPVAERSRCRAAVWRFAIKHSPKLARDVVIATEHLVLGRPDATG